MQFVQHDSPRSTRRTPYMHCELCISPTRTMLDHVHIEHSRTYHRDTKWWSSLLLCCYEYREKRSLLTTRLVCRCNSLITSRRRHNAKLQHSKQQTTTQRAWEKPCLPAERHNPAHPNPHSGSSARHCRLERARLSRQAARCRAIVDERFGRKLGWSLCCIINLHIRPSRTT